MRRQLAGPGTNKDSHKPTEAISTGVIYSGNYMDKAAGDNRKNAPGAAVHHAASDAPRSGGGGGGGGGAKFDPHTGEPIPKFDPHTGRQNW